MKEIYAVWLGDCEGLTGGDRRKLIRTYGSARSVYEASEKELRMLLPEKSGRICKARQTKESLKEAEEKLQTWENMQIRYLSMEDRAYPERLREIKGNPYALYVLGELPDLTHAVAIVGARRISQYGRRMAEQLGTSLAAIDVPVISGMARGVDSTAQQACVAAGGKTVAVLGCGVDICYPPELKPLYEEIRHNGCIISEFPPGTQPLPAYFPSRNRIISGLSETVVVVEAAEKSGSLITADMALEQGRDVWAVPGRVGDVNSAGCNRLISQGAGIILNPEEFLVQSGIYEKAAEHSEKGKGITEIRMTSDREQYTPAVVRGGREGIVYEALDLYPKNISELAAETHLEVSQLQIVLTEMELKGLIRQVGTGFFERL